MEHIRNSSVAAAIDAPADYATPADAARPAACLSNRLDPGLLGSALDAGRDVRPGRAARSDGWTPDRIRIFLETLAECGVVEDAARAAGMSKQTAYRLRKRAAGRAFHVAWNAAEQLARNRLAGEVVSRALHGCVEVIVRDGQVWGERHRFDNRLTMAVLERLDRNAAANDEENRVARLVAEEFDQFLDILCAGGEDAAAFVAARIEADRWTPAREARTLARCDNYRRYGVGLPEEIDVTDLDPDARESWTAEQRERAERSGMLDTNEGEEADEEEVVEDEDDN
jgi:hypothetical protein